jgi:hypothetical protein
LSGRVSKKLPLYLTSSKKKTALLGLAFGAQVLTAHTIDRKRIIDKILVIDIIKQIVSGKK